MEEESKTKFSMNVEFSFAFKKWSVRGNILLYGKVKQCYNKEEGFCVVQSMPKGW